MLVKILYSVFLGILLATFVGFGVATFYPSPEAPDYPLELETIHMPDSETAEIDEGRTQALRTEYDKQYESYQQRQETYLRNASLIVVGIAVVVLVISLTAPLSLRVIADGLLMGGVFTLLYGVILSFGADDTRLSFAVVAVALAVAIVVGYKKFAHTSSKK